MENISSPLIGEKVFSVISPVLLQGWLSATHASPMGWGDYHLNFAEESAREAHYLGLDETVPVGAT